MNLDERVADVARQAKERKRKKWQWIQANLPEFAAKQAGLDPREPIISGCDDEEAVR